MIKLPFPDSTEVQDRLDHTRTLREQHNINPYPYAFDRTHTASVLHARFDHLEAGSNTEDEATVAGRLMSERGFGKGIFCDLMDATGRIQVLFSQAHLPEEQFQVIKKLVGRGDVVGVRGQIMKTRTGELTLRAHDVQLLSKCLVPLPEKWHGLKDVEIQRNQRYLQLIVDEDLRQRVRQRAAVIRHLRQVLESHDFLEVQTPTLQPLYGGAEATPFVTHHEALDVNLYLRIAPELYLKRLLVGGLERVYEICSCYRNEGIDSYHNPEFTMLELYWAYVDLQTMIAIARELISTAAQVCIGKTTFRVKLPGGAEAEVDLVNGWQVRGMFDLIEEHTGLDLRPVTDLEQARQLARTQGVDFPEDATSADWFALGMFEIHVEPKLIGPVFVTGFPKETSPLCKADRTNPRLAERFELFIGGREYANAYSEQTDPIAQFDAFVAQRPDGPIDEDYILAMGYGLPPCGGVGFGIDRLIMLLTETEQIRDVILFPTTRSGSLRYKQTGQSDQDEPVTDEPGG